MQHEVLAVLALERIDDLLVLAVPSVATTSAWVSPRVNKRGAVRARQNADFARDRTHGPRIATVDPRPVVQDLPANDLAFQFLELRWRPASGSKLLLDAERLST